MGVKALYWGPPLGSRLPTQRCGPWNRKRSVIDVSACGTIRDRCIARCTDWGMSECFWDPCGTDPWPGVLLCVYLPLRHFRRGHVPLPFVWEVAALHHFVGFQVQASHVL